MPSGRWNERWLEGHYFTVCDDSYWSEAKIEETSSTPWRSTFALYPIYMTFNPNARTFNTMTCKAVYKVLFQYRNYVGTTTKKLRDEKICSTMRRCMVPPWHIWGSHDLKFPARAYLCQMFAVYLIWRKSRMYALSSIQESTHQCYCVHVLMCSSGKVTIEEKVFSSNPSSLYLHICTTMGTTVFDHHGSFCATECSHIITKNDHSQNLHELRNFCHRGPIYAFQLPRCWECCRLVLIGFIASVTSVDQAHDTPAALFPAILMSWLPFSDILTSTSAL
jgi:hypothetical protein